MSTKRIKALRILSAFLLLSMVNQILFPTVAFALTSMDTQPEIWGYQAVDATDNVNLGTGNFSYTIPITSIPEFPMAIGYNAGMGMEQEASCFGFGFNGFTGAITRTVRGLPDDVNGITKRYGFGNEPQKDINTTVSFNLGRSVSNSIQIGFTATSLFGFNNYTGGYGGIGIGLGVGMVQKMGSGKNMGGGASIGAGIQFMNDSRETAPRIGAGAGLGIGMGSKKYGQGLSLGGVYATKSLSSGSKWQTGKSILGQQIGVNSFPASSRNATSSMAPLAGVYPKQGGSRLTMGFSIYLFSFGTSWAKYKYPQYDVNKKGYGFMYLYNYDRSDNDAFADMTVEGEDSFNENSYNNPSYLQKDDYSVNTMGISGGMELYQKSYGVVSRNTYSSQINERKTYKTKSLFKEVHPWIGVNQTSQNKSIDVLALLKDVKNLASDSETNDITNSAYSFFSEDEKVSLNKDDHRFNEAEFKMRGDYAGEYDLASDDYKDHEVNRFDMVHISGTGEKAKFAHFGREKNVPLYYPESPRDYDAYANTHKIERSTQITKHTIGEMIKDASLNEADPQGGPVTDPASPYYRFNIAQSMYTYYDYVPDPDPIKNLPKSQIKLNDHLVKKNIIKDLKELADNELADKKNPYVNSLIGGMDIQSTNGLRYYFNLPVFNKSSRNQELLGHGHSAPIREAGDYHSYKRDGSHYERCKTDVNDDYVYPYAWLLTAVVGDDYIDFDNVPGPSDGDIGYWVKFRYVKAADNYRWRMPFTGMNHYEGLLQVTDDDVYSVASGEKEIYYVSEIESSNYLCKYQYQKRFDAIDAARFDNGDAHNSIRDPEPGFDKNNLGTHYQFAVTQIDLYKKHNNGSNSATMSESTKKKIKSTVFSYDYTTSSLVPNSMGTYQSQLPVKKSDVKYHIPFIATPDCSIEPPQGFGADPNIGSGKITLRQVQHIAYDENEVAVNLPSYTFNYYGDCDSKYNPAYNRNAVDQWGNYMAGSVDQFGNIKYYHHYTENMKEEADENSRVFKLKNIHLPSGGSMNINYQAQSYGFVENQVPFAMRHVVKVEPTPGEDYNTTITVDVSDCPDGLKKTKTRDGLNNEVPLLSVGEEVYGELMFYRNTLPTKEDPKNVILISEHAKVIRIADDPYYLNGKYYQEVQLTAVTGTELPFIDQCQNYMYFGSNEARAIGDEVNSNKPCEETVQIFLDRYENLYRDIPIDAMRKIIAHGDHMVRSDQGTKNRFISCFGEPGTKIYPHQSFLRTRINKAKYTGAVVSSVILKDGFNYASAGTVDNPSVTSKDNVYGTRYYYDLNDDGSGTSAGVATSEPGGGKSCVLDPNATTGAGFMAAPSIVYSRTTLENNYTEAAPGSTKAPRKKGKTAYEFYTAKEEGYQFASNFKQEQTYDNPGPLHGNFFLFGILTFLRIKIPFTKLTLSRPKLIPIILKWDLDDRYHTRSYAYTDHTDIFGRVKAIHQIDASGQELGSQTYNYFGKDEPVKVYNKSFENSSLKRPGKMDQIWSEAYYTKEDEIQLIAALYLQAKCNKNYNYTTMKYSYIPPVLKEVVSNADGMKTTMTNTGFDYLTGTAVEAKSNDSYNNEKIARVVPAYWVYSEMGPNTSITPNNLNNLLATTGSYNYLNMINDAHLLDASVVRWTSNTSKTWSMIPYLQPQLSEGNRDESKYYYTYIPGNTVRDAYSSTLTNKFVKHNAFIYKSYEGYSYEGPLKTDGTFESFSNFNYLTGTMNVGWKKLSTNEFFTHNGALIQSKDVLSKYSSQLIGYNNLNTIGVVMNSSWAGAAYEGAENTYAKAVGTLMLEDDKVKLQDAKVIKACVPNYITRFLNHSEMTNANILSINIPSTYTKHNEPFARIQVTYYTGVSRTFFLYLNSNNEFEIMTNKGESFEGFIVFKQPDGTFKLVFDPYVFTSFVVDNSSITDNITLNYAVNQTVPNCSVLTKPYKIPEQDCLSKVHTGSYAFVLDGNKKGTEFILSTNNLSASELKRKYKALVWVHNSSTDKTELVMQITNTIGALQQEFKTSKATPYVVAGDWSLLRLDVDLSTITNMSSLVAHVFVRNTSSSGQSIYDDYRVLPYYADMSNWVFDHQFNRVVSGLDADNYASYSEYDPRGRVTVSSVELQNEGKKVVQKFLYNDQKKN